MKNNELVSLEKEEEELNKKFSEEKANAQKAHKQKIDSIKKKKLALKMKSEKELSKKTILFLNGELSLDELKEFALTHKLIKEETKQNKEENPNEQI